MLARAALRPCRLGLEALLNGSRSKAVAPAALVVRCQSDLSKQLQTWDKAHEKYYGPERDLKNFPHPTQPETSPPVRLGFIPKTAMDFFYNKTGVTGPYVLGGGLALFLLSKEIWVIEHGFFNFMVFYPMVAVLAWKLGPWLSAYADKRSEKQVMERYVKPVEEAKAAAQAHVDALEKAIWSEEGQKHLYEAKRENVALQLEAQYRERLNEVHTAVKKRLNYMVELQNIQRRFEQQHMVSWIVNNVVKSITPQQEKEAIASCINNLKELSKKVNAAAV